MNKRSRNTLDLIGFLGPGRFLIITGELCFAAALFWLAFRSHQREIWYQNGPYRAPDSLRTAFYGQCAGGCFWFGAAAVRSSALVYRWKAHRRLRRREAGLCGACGYDLRASTDRCPECGEPVRVDPGVRGERHVL